jgi:hypothetical protein
MLGYGVMDACDPGATESPVMHYRLHSSAFSVDVRLLEVNGRWISSADTPGGPSLGYGCGPFEALWGALEPFSAVVDELLASMPILDGGPLPE